MWWGRKVVFLLTLWGFVELKLRLPPLLFPFHDTASVLSHPLPAFSSLPWKLLILKIPLSVRALSPFWRPGHFSVDSSGLSLFGQRLWVIGPGSAPSRLAPAPCNRAICFSQSLKQSVHGEGTQRLIPSI